MSANFKSTLGNLVKTIIPLAFGVVVLVFMFLKLDFDTVKEILKQDVNWWIIAVSLPFGLGANIVRAYRWRLLIRPLGYNPKISNLIYAVLGNYGVNLVFPRLGEIWRCTMIKQYEKIPFGKLLGTLINDRLADSLSVILITLFAFALNIPYFKSFPDLFLGENPEYSSAFIKLYEIITSVWLYVAFAAVILLVWFILYRLKHIEIVKKINEMLAGVWEGIKTILKMKERGLFLLHTFLIWFGYFLYFYICFYAFSFTEDLGWICGLIAFALSSVAMAVPIPGGLGIWHAVVAFVLVGFKVDATSAVVFALCVHTIQQFVFTAAFGLFGVLALPIANRKHLPPAPSQGGGDAKREPIS